MSDTLPRPLNGVRVVELASFMSGPFATMMLSDLGADVTKVEPPRGDPFRRFGRSTASMSPMFVSTNRGKQSVAFDLKAESDRAALQEMLARADVMVCNWRPTVAPRLGVDDALLEEANPRLIRVYITGFGPDGPSADEPTFDAIVQGRLGWGEAFGSAEEPRLAPHYLVDKLAAAMVCQAALAALVARARDGKGQRVEVALLDAAAYLNFPDILANRTLAEQHPAEARNRQAAAVRPIRASDGWMVIAPVTGSQVRRALVTAGLADRVEEILGIEDASELAGRVFDAVEGATKSKPVEHWLKAFADADVPAGPCLTLDQHLDDEQVRHNNIYVQTEWRDLGLVRHVRYPARFEGVEPLFGRSAAPALGAHEVAAGEIGAEGSARG